MLCKPQVNGLCKECWQNDQIHTLCVTCLEYHLYGLNALHVHVCLYQYDYIIPIQWPDKRALMFAWLTGTIVPFMDLYKVVTLCTLHCKTSRSFIPLDKWVCFSTSPCWQQPSAPCALARRYVLVRGQAVLATFPGHVKKFEFMPLTFHQRSTELSIAVEILSKFFVRWIPFVCFIALYKNSVLKFSACSK